jgi:uncharacterized BrkB/YihY/UPF0761 family membrane protein
MENQPQPEIVNELDNFFNISFDANSREQLKQIALWSKICSICAFAGYIVSLVVAIFGHRNLSLEADGFSFGAYFRSSNNSLVGVLITVVIGGIVNYFLYRFAVAVGEGVENTDALKVNTGFNSLHIYFKILGIGLIIALSLLLLVFLFALIAGVTAPRY